ncbi:MAG: ABC transporter ATP-binding protein [Anaerolineae bacterium]
MMSRRRRRNRGAAQTNETPNDAESLEAPEGPVQWRRLVGYMTPYWRRILLALLATMISAGLSLIFPQIIGQVIDSVFEEQNLDRLNQITVFLLGVFFLQSISTLIETYNINYVGERMVIDLRAELYRHLQRLSLAFYVRRRVGELVSRNSSDVTVMRTALVSNLSTLLQQTFVLIGSVALMLALNWRLTLFIVALIPVLVLVGFAFGFLLQRLSTQVQDELAGATVVVEEALQGIREVKSFVREDYEIKRHESALKKAFDAAIRLLRIRAVFGPIVAFLGFGSLALVLWFGGREVLDDRLTSGELVTFLFYGVTVAGSFASLVGLYTQFQEALGATKRVFQILDTAPEVQNKPNAQVMERAEGRITFNNVSFSYDDKQEVLHNINLEIAPGEILALVGPSGAGKSTIFNLIPRFYDVTEGQLCLDGIDLRDLTQDSLRDQIGIVPQESLLFGGSIRENIRYGRLNATDEEIYEAARAANAHDFILEMPDGYETVVGERGVRLSGGQRQRVAIARAILKDPRILLLDEATSSLDSESEHLVQDALARLMQNRTTIIIAHRLSTVRVADRIAVLQKGSVVEIGTHDELLTKGGLYARLYEMQFREDDIVFTEPASD